MPPTKELALFSFFTNAKNTKPTEEMDLLQFIKRLTKPEPRVSKLIDEMRVIEDEDEQNKLKKQLPGVTFGGIFSTRARAGLEEASGLFIYDLDNVNVRKVKLACRGMKGLLLAFTSPRGNGVKIVLSGPHVDSSEEYTIAWRSGARIVEEQTGCVLDMTGTDVSRLCFMSFDPKPLVVDADDVLPFKLDKAVEKKMAADKKAKETGMDEDGNPVDMPEPKDPFAEYTSKDIREMLWTVGSDVEYDSWRNIIWSVVSKLGRSHWVREMLLEWSLETGGDRKMKTEDDKKNFNAIFDATEGKGITLATLVKLAREKGWVNWRGMLRRDEDGDLMHDEANLRILLDNHPDLKGRFYFDTIVGEMRMMPKDKVAVCVRTKRGGLLSDEMAFDMVCDVQEGIGMGFSGEKKMYIAMAAACKANSINPRKDWLEKLEWDGTERLGRLFIDGFGAAACARNEELGRAFLCGAAARIIRPGVLVQTVPILIGPQGTGKSSGIAALCPEQSWVCDSIVDFESQKGYEAVRGSAVVELSELSSMKKADIDKIKQFITQPTVKYRVPWARQAEVFQASWVFIGTTNKEEFLKDTTGNRRFAPVKITAAKVDKVVKWCRDNKDQLWAEAVAVVKEGWRVGKEAWHVNKAFWDDIAVQQDAAMEHDPWYDLVCELSGNILRKHPEGVHRKLLDVATETGIAIRNRTDELHLASVLRRVGWERKLVKIGDERAARWCLSGF